MFPICYKKQTKDIADHLVYFVLETNRTILSQLLDGKMISGHQP